MQRKKCHGKNMETDGSSDLFTLYNDHLQRGMQLSKRTVIIIQRRRRPSHNRLDCPRYARRIGKVSG
jgi:hypothetical protein